MVPEAFEKKRLVVETFPARVKVPVAETLNWVEELVWKFKKSPRKVMGFTPSQVPETAPPWMGFTPSWIYEVEVET